MRRTAIATCLAAGLLGVTAATAGAATLAPSTANFGSQPVGTASAPKVFTVTAELPDTVLPLTIATTGDFKQTSNCPATIGFLTTSSCTVNVTFVPTAVGARNGTLSTTTLVVGGPSASLTGAGTSAAVANTAGKCKKKGKKHSKKHARVAKKKGKKGKKCKKGKKGKKKKH